MTQHDPGQTATARRAAHEALQAALVDPPRGGRLASAALRLARSEGDQGAVSLCERALGLEARANDDLFGAESHLRRAIRAGELAGSASLAGGARTTLVSVLYLQGRVAAALRAADRAATELSGHDLAVLRMQRANVLMMQGRRAEAQQGYAAALPVFRAEGDVVRLAMTYNNRGLLALSAESLSAAEHDLRLAEQLYDELGDRRSVADVRQHLGMTLARRGNLPEALSWFRRADEILEELGAQDPLALLDRMDALLSARLLEEARQVAETAATQLRARRMWSYLPEVRLWLAEVALLDGDAAEARTAARLARRAFARHERLRHAALCGYVAVRADALEDRPSPARLQRARRSAAALDAAGWRLAAVDARLLAARIALALGRPDAAVGELEHVRAGRLRGPVSLRSRAWHAVALLRLAQGDRPGAQAALRAGVRLLDRYRATLPATELRVQASGHGTDLAVLGLDIAIGDGRAGPVLAWAERCRARALQSRPVRAPADPALKARLEELRAVARETETEALAGRGTRQLERRQAGLERAIRDQARLASGRLSGASRPVSVTALRRALGAGVLLEFVESVGRLHVVAVDDRGSRLTDLGPVAPVRQDVEMLRFALRRLAFANASRPALVAAARTAAASAAGRLATVLLAPVSRLPDDVPTVVVPSASLHGLPWPALEPLASRPLTVAPSATLWWTCADEAAGTEAPAQVALVSGPDLAFADREVRDLAAEYDGSTALVGAQATVEAALRATNGASLVHVAAHGQFRSDNPLFSSLRLHDGPMTVYDLEGLAHAPDVFVLASCDVGTSDARAGDEVIGLAVALLGLGTRSVVSSLLPVPDEAVHGLMLAFHRRLRAGTGPALALAQARTEMADAADRGPGCLSSFQCLGYG